MWNLSFLFIFFLGCLSISNSYATETIKIATASNFLSPLKNLKHQFEIESDTELIIISGSTSKLYAQIMNGAPYDVFLSADQSTTIKLIENKLAIKDSASIYATGKLALWRGGNEHKALDLRNDLQNVLKNLEFKRLAIANPKLAPYGRAAIEVLKNLSLYDKVKTRLVYGENIGQTFQFVYSGNAELGLVAMSQIKQFNNAGDYWEIPLELYQPIKQSAVLLNRAKNKPAAKLFMQFLKSKKIQKEISSKYGYLSLITQNSLMR